MSFKTDCKVIAISLQRFELSDPVHNTFSNRGPVIFATALDGILAMAVPNSVFWKQIVAVRIWRLAQSCRVPRIPIQHERGMLHGHQNFCRVFSSSGIARSLVLEHEQE